jgi:hypothetical protein
VLGCGRDGGGTFAEEGKEYFCVGGVIRGPGCGFGGYGVEDERAKGDQEVAHLARAIAVRRKELLRRDAWRLTQNQKREPSKLENRQRRC